MRIITCFVLLCSMFSAAPVVGRQASNPSRTSEPVVSGRVTDSNGIALVGASVELRISPSELTRYGAQTDSDGRFAIQNVAKGTYTVRISFLGYSTWTRHIDLSTETFSDVVIELSEEAVPYPEVIVSFRRTSKAIQPVTISNITAEELERAPAMKDLPVLLARQPSITYYSENGNGMGYSTLRMRGFGQRRLAIAINGIPQNDPEEFNVFWINFFDIQGVVEDVQIQRGAGASLYGPAAIGGAVNIRAMPYRPEFFTRVEVGGGSFNTRRYTAEVNSGLLGDKVVLFGRVSRLLSDGYRDWSWTEFWRFFAGGTMYGENSTLTVQAYGGPQKDGLAYSGIPKAANTETIDDGFGGTIDRKYNFSSFDGDVENFHQPHVEVHHDLNLSPSLSLSQSLFWVKGEGFFDFGGTFRSANYLRLPDGYVADDERDLPLFISKPEASVLFRAYLDQWQIGWVPRLTFSSDRATTTVGLEARFHRSYRWGRMQEATNVPAELVGSENDARVYAFRSEKKMASVYASTVYNLAPKWTLQADLQVTYRVYRFYDEEFFGNEFEKPYVFANPRVGVTFKPDPRTTVHASVAYAQREPRMKSLYDGEEAGAGFLPAFEQNQDGSWNTDEPFVASENLIDIEFGAAYVFERARIGANLFYMDFNDEIIASGGLDQFGVPRSGNAENSIHAGIELELAVSLVAGLQFRGNTTISRNRFRTFTEYATLPDFSVAPLDRADNPIAGFPDNIANAGLVYVRNGLNAEIYLAYVGKAYVDNSGGTLADGTPSDIHIIDSYTMVDMVAGYEFPVSSVLANLRLNVALNNVLNQKVLQYGNVGFPDPQFFPAATRHVYAGLRYTIK